MIKTNLRLPCGHVLKNRVAKSAMSENMATSEHISTPQISKLYQRWAQGGAGLIITGNVMIDHNALGEANNVVIERGLNFQTQLEQWAKYGSENDTSLWVQLNHPGKQSPKFLSKQPMAPSAIEYPAPMNNMFAKPKALSIEEIRDIISRFGYAANQVKECGFSGVQIHAAHGYLLSQFLSPLHNQRNDEWGGSIDNRMRIIIEVFKAMRAEVGPKFPIGIKLNSADFQKGGFSEDESMIVVKKLGELGIDLIEVSGGTYEAPAMTGSKQKDSTIKREAYFQDYCNKIRTVVKTPLMLTGGFRTANGMNEALKSGDCDIVGIARAMAIEPDFVNKIFADNTIESLVKPLSTGFRMLDKLIPLEITWYSHQLQRMGNGLEPDPNASPLFSAVKTIFSFGLDGVKRVRSK